MQHSHISTLLQPTTSLRSISHILDEYYKRYPNLNPEDDFTAERSFDARASAYTDEVRPVFRQRMTEVARLLAPRVSEIVRLRQTPEGIIVIFVPLDYARVTDHVFDFLRKRGIIGVKPADRDGTCSLIVINSSIIAPMEVVMVISHVVVSADGDSEVDELADDMYDSSMNLSYKIQINEQYEGKRS